MPPLKLSSDLMQNFRPLLPASEEKRMQAVCQDGIKAFLSISDDGRLFITAEQKESSTTGWQRTDISADIRHECGENAQVTTFSVNADRDTATHVLVAVLSANKKQMIYLSSNGCLTNPVWVLVPLPEEVQSLTFHDILVSSYQGKVVISAYYQKPNGHMERYCMTSSDTTYSQWTYSPLPTDFSSITDARLGRPAYSRIDGTYTLGVSGKDTQLLFTPAYNYYDPELAPASSRLSLPCKADAISTLPSVSVKNGTDIFVCGEGSLYLFSCRNQDDMAKPIQIAVSPHFYDVRQLFSFVSKGRVYVWLRNESKYVCYLFADCNHADDPDAWSVVSVLKEDVSYFYPFCEGNTNAIYGYTTQGDGILGYESEESGLWSYTTVFVAENLKKSVLVNSFVTLIKTPEPNQEILLASKSRQMMDINGSVYLLGEHPIRVKSNGTGDIRVMELSESPYATQISAWTEEDSDTTWYQPDQHITDKLFSLTTGQAISDAAIRSQTGKTEYLVPRDTPQESIQAVAQALQSLNDSRRDLERPQKGRRNASHGVHLRLENGKLTHVPWESKAGFYAQLLQNQPIVYQSEDVLGCLRSLCIQPPADGFSDIIIDFFSDVWHFIVKIGEKVVSFVLDSVEKIVSCAVEIFRFIQVTAKKIIDFLKYVFDMDDILMAKDVIKKILNASHVDAKQSIEKLKQITEEAFDSLEQDILAWAGIEDIGEIGKMNLQQIQDNSSEEAYVHDVHANYLTNTFTEHIASVDLIPVNQPELSNVLSNRIDTIIDQLSDLYETEKDAAENLIKRLQQEFFDDEKIKSMDLLTILQKLGAILAGALIEGISDIVTLMFDLVTDILDQFFALLNQNLYIPCVSEFLELCGIGSFSFLDVLCFLPAFTGTVISKIVMQRPLVSKEMYSKIMKIQSLSDLKTVAAAQNASSYNKELFLSLKCLSGFASITECVLAAIDFSTNQKSSLVGIGVAVMAGIDGALYLANSFFVYQPLDGRLKTIPKYILTAVKYFPFLSKGVYLYYNIIRKNKEKAEKWDKIFASSYAVTSTVSIGGNIYYLVEACKLSDVDSEERKLYILDTVSLIPDNLRNVADGALRYVKPDKVIAFAAILVARSLCGLAYSALQISEGGCAYSDKIAIPEQSGD